MKRIIIAAFVSCLLQTYSYCQLKNYNNNGKILILGEKTTLFVNGVSTIIVPEERDVGLLAAAGTILPPVVDLVVNNIKAKSEKNALSYIGEYKCSSSGDKFYIDNSSAALPMITFRREIKTKKGLDTTAVEIVLVPELSTDKTAFRYSIRDNIVYNYSIAKTKGRYDFIDLNIVITFKSISICKNEYKISDLRTTAIVIPMIPVGKTTKPSDRVYSGWIPLPPRSDSLIKQKVQGTGEGTTDLNNNDPVYGKITFNTGLYEIEITVTETNPYKIKAENKNKIVETSSESATGILKAIIETLTKEEK